MVDSTLKNKLDKFCDAFLASGDKAAKDNLKAGAPISYRDKKGRLVREYPDGSKEIIEEAN